MKRRNVAAVMLAGMLVAGLASAGQRAFAHTFSTDENANFLVLIEGIRVHLALAKSNASVNPVIAHEHIEHAMMHLDANTLKDLAEKNKRVATDLPAALEKLGTMIHEGKPKVQVSKQFSVISGLLGEAVSARVDKKQQATGTVQALVMAGLVDEALEAYHEAYGAPESHEHSMTMNDTMSMSAEDDNHAMSDDHETHSATITNKVAYESSKAFATKASSMYAKLNKLAPKGSEADMKAVKAGLAELRTAISHKEHVDDVTILVHSKIHENLEKAFDLKKMDDDGS
ncbi:MAG: hypothetical protein ABI347_05315 [Nitrososphaera sp.]|jgi:hypothetical protein